MDGHTGILALGAQVLGSVGAGTTSTARTATKTYRKPSDCLPAEYTAPKVDEPGDESMAGEEKSMAGEEKSMAGEERD